MRIEDLAFGKNNFFLPILKQPTGQEILTSLLTDEEQLELLNLTNLSDTRYAISAFLFRIDLEFSGHRFDFLAVRKKLSLIKFDYTLSVDHEFTNEQGYYHIDLHDCLPDNYIGESYWIKIENDSCTIGQVLIDNNKASIFSQYPLRVSGKNSITSLQVYSDEGVLFKDSINVTDTFLVYAKKLSLDPDIKKIEARNCIFYCTEFCETNGDFEIDTLQIKSALLVHNGYIEAKNLVQIVTFETKQNGDIFSEKGVLAISKKWTYGDDTSATIHSPGFVQMLVHDYIHLGCISTNKLLLHTVESLFEGDLIAGQKAQIIAERYLEKSTKARFYLNGQIEISSNFTAKFGGQIFYSKDLKVNWKKISRSKSISDYAIIQEHEDLQSILRLNAGAYLEITGNIYAKNVDLHMFSYNQILHAGNIWHEGGLFKKYSMYLKSNEMQVYGDLITTGKVNVEVKNYLSQSGYIDAKQINIAADNYHLAPDGLVSTCQLNVQVESGIHADKKSVIGSKYVYMRGRDAILRGKVKSEHVAIEARRLIYVSGNAQVGELICTSPIFAGVGCFTGIEKLLITSYVSLLTGFFLVKQMNNSSLLNVSPLSLTVQYGPAMPLKLTLAMTAISTGLSIANLVFPQLQAVTVPFQIALNSFSQIFSTKQMLDQVRITVAQLRGNYSTSDQIRTFIVISQLAVALSSIILSLQNTIGAMTKLHLPQSIDFQKPTLIPLAKVAGNSVGRLASGNNNFSLVDFGLLRSFVGISSQESHIFSFAIGDTFALVNSDTSFVSVKNGFDFILGPSSSTSIIRVDSGNTFSLTGNMVKNYVQLTLLPVISTIALKNNPFKVFGNYYNWSIQASHISYPLTAYRFNHSSLSTTHILVLKEQTMKFDRSSVDAAKIDIYGKWQANNSYVHADTFFINGNQITQPVFNIAEEKNAQATFDGSMVDVKLFNNHGEVITASSRVNSEVDNYGTYISITSQVNIKKLHNHGGQAQFALSDGKIGEIHNDLNSLLAIDASKLTGYSYIDDIDSLTSIRSSKFTVTNKSIINGKFDTYNSDISLSEITGNNVIAKFTINDTWLATDRNTLPITQTNSNISDGKNEDEHKKFIEHQIQYEAKFEQGRFIYKHSGTLILQNQEIYSILPIGYYATGKVDMADQFFSLGNITITSDDLFVTDNNAQILLMSDSQLEGKNNIIYNKSTIDCREKLFLKTNGKMVNNASSLTGDKGFYVTAKEGVESSPEVITTSETHKHWQWHGLHSGFVEKTEIKTTINPASMNSPHGKVYIDAPDKNINTTATFFNAQEVIFDAHNGDVNILDAEVRYIITTKNYTLLGYSKDTFDSVNFIPSSLLGKDNVTIRATGKVYARGVVVQTDKFVIRALDAVLDRSISKVKMQHEAYVIMSNGATNSIFSEKIDFYSFIPSIDAGRQIANAQSNLETGSILANLGANSVNKANDFLTDIRKGTRLSRATANLLINKEAPTKLFSFNVTAGEQKTTQIFEALGPGSADAKLIDIKVENNLEFNNGFELKPEQSLQISAKHTEFNTPALHTSFFSEQTGVTGSFSVLTLSMTDASFGTQYVNTSQTHHPVNIIDVPKLKLNIEDMSLSGTVINADELSGHVDKICIISQKDQKSSKSANGEVGLSGSISYGQQANYEESIPVKSSLTAKDSSSFTVREVDTVAATINLAADKMESTDLILEKSKHGFEFSGNITDFTSDRSPLFIWSGKNTNVLNTVNVSVTRDDEQINFKIPFVNRPGLEEVKDNIRYFTGPTVPMMEESIASRFQISSNQKNGIKEVQIESRGQEEELMFAEQMDIALQNAMVMPAKKHIQLSSELFSLIAKAQSDDGNACYMPDAIEIIPRVTGQNSCNEPIAQNDMAESFLDYAGLQAKPIHFTETTERSFWDMLNPISTANAAEVKEPRAGDEFTYDTNLSWFGSTNYSSELAGITTAAYLTTLYDYNLLKYNYSIYNSVASSHFPELFSDHIKQIYKVTPKEYTEMLRGILYGSTFGNKYYASPITASIMKDTTITNMLEFDWSTITTHGRAWDAFKESVENSLFSNRGLKYFKWGSNMMLPLSATSSAYTIGNSDDKLYATGREAYALGGSILGGTFLSEAPANSIAYALKNLFYGNLEIPFPPSAFRTPYLSIPFSMMGSVIGAYGLTKLYDNTEREEVGANLLNNAYPIWQDYKASNGPYHNQFKPIYNQTVASITETMQDLVRVTNNSVFEYSNFEEALRFNAVSTIDKFLQQRSDIISNVQENCSPIGEALYSKHLVYEAVDFNEEGLLTNMYGKIINAYPEVGEPLLKGDYLKTIDIIKRNIDLDSFSERSISMMSIASKGLTIAGLGFSGYEIIEADNKIKESVHQGLLLGGGRVGFLVAQRLIPVMCTFVRPVCIGISLFAGSSIGSQITNSVWEKADEWWQDYHNESVKQLESTPSNIQASTHVEQIYGPHQRNTMFKHGYSSIPKYPYEQESKKSNSFTH